MGALGSWCSWLLEGEAIVLGWLGLPRLPLPTARRRVFPSPPFDKGLARRTGSTWLVGALAGGTFVARFALEVPELAPPRVVGGVFGDAALPRAAENPPSLLKTRVRVRRQCRRI